MSTDVSTGGGSGADTAAHQFLGDGRVAIVDDARGLPWGHPMAYIALALRRGIAGLMPQLLPAGGRVLDFGCADSPYRSIVPAGAEYVAADLPGNPKATVLVRDNGTLPCADGEFDAVLSSQVLEHVRNPATYLAECRRVLRPGGRLLLSTHGTMFLHRDPVDYWRWTCDGLRLALEQAGFRVIELRGVMGLTPMGLLMVLSGTYRRVPKFLRRLYSALFQGLMRFFDRLHSDASRAENALVYVVLAEREGA
ncbi:MAG TPA: class I SAM-dependent methyltransferase [Nevskia sp.]|nr:class I SAM-dependent methyltransferase [Nevskia sp.]